MALKRAPGSSKRPEAGDMLLVQTRVKEYLREHGLMAGVDVVDELNQRMKQLLDRAIARANDNGRKTVRAIDV